MLHRWKKQLLDNGSAVFGSNTSSRSSQIDSTELDKLHATIGRLKVENDFLQQVSAKLKL